ncbi:MAG: hypothetical protein RE468_04825 [Acidithiobacillus caldus]|uniref:hypothetical protein n=1 Tax=Acidithiobacillus caldus TaxID=33059 RepID=UPI002816242C|nr:hypothetical protein [Acidithiobacillus caldus]WMT47936.1 MAG: hypothetical protein RE468_04825 [Acidithiobacillus caldus]
MAATPDPTADFAGLLAGLRPAGLTLRAAWLCPSGLRPAGVPTAGAATAGVLSTGLTTDGALCEMEACGAGIPRDPWPDVAIGVFNGADLSCTVGGVKTGAKTRLERAVATTGGTPADRVEVTGGMDASALAFS